MKIIGINADINDTESDVVSARGTIEVPTAARIHNIVSGSAEDDWDGTKQQETATAAGTVAGIAQVEAATVAGTCSGSGNLSVVVTSAAVTGSPLTLSVAVTNGDTDAQMATKIRAALNATAAITAVFSVGGSSTAVSLTAITAAANDSTLNIALATGTATGLTAAPTSANSTAGAVTGLTASVTVTGADITGSPLTILVPVTLGDTASVWAGKVRTVLAGTTAIAANYTVSGTTTAIVLTRKTAADNDSTLNIGLRNGNSTGITTATTSSNTTDGIAGTGAKSVKIEGITGDGTATSEIVRLQGKTAVPTTKSYKWINRMSIEDGATNEGVITATAAVDDTVSIRIEIGGNVSKYAVFANGGTTTKQITSINVLCENSDGEKTTLMFYIRSKKGLWTEMFTALIEDKETFSNVTPLPEIRPGEIFKISALTAAGTTEVKAYITID